MELHELALPFCYPLRVLFDEHVIELIELTRGSFELLMFQDAPTLRTFPIAARWSFAELFANAESIKGQTKPPRYIFHTAFCGSTLLARYLDCPGHTFSHREPAVLTHLASTFGRDRSLLEPGPGRRVLAAVTTLLSRKIHEEEVAVIKGWDALNAIAAPVLASYEGSRAVLMSCELEQFATSCLHSGERRRWTRERLALLQSWKSERAPYVCRNDAEIAACLWMIQRSWVTKLERELGLLLLSMESLLDRPVEQACLAASHLGLSEALIARNVERILEAPSHAKNGNRYDREDHQRRKAFERERLGDELKLAYAFMDAHEEPF